MTWKLARALMPVLALVSACSDDETTADREPGEPCKPASHCADCGTCFEECRCDGGTTERCAEECTDGPSDAGADAKPDAAPPDVPFTATIAVESFDIPPGAEVYRCQNFENPFGRPVAVVRSESFMTSGSHHMFVFQSQGLKDGELETCGGLEFGPNVHRAQSSQATVVYPEGVGRYLGDDEGLRIQVHYLNTTLDTIHTAVAVTLHAMAPEEVTSLASQIFVNTIDINVPPHSSGRATNSCVIPHDVQLVDSVSHMHQHGVYFSARDAERQLLYETSEWAEPEPWVFESPRRLKGGTTIAITCDYENPNDYALTFGESARSNEMCIFSGTYFPAQKGEGITCLF